MHVIRLDYSIIFDIIYLRFLYSTVVSELTSTLNNKSLFETMSNKATTTGITIILIFIVVAFMLSHSVFATSYEKNQAITQTNECGNYWFPINVICSNLGSQVQGDENSVTVDAASSTAAGLVNA